MTIKVTITHDEPANAHGINVGLLVDIPGYDTPQYKETHQVEPGKSISLHVYEGQSITIGEAPLPIELKVAEVIERALRDPVKINGKLTIGPRNRIKAAKAAIAALR